MSLNTKERKTKTWKKLFALPRGKLCIREKSTKQIPERFQNNEEFVEGVHPRLV